MQVENVESLANTISSELGGPEVPSEVVTQYLHGKLAGEVYENQRELHPKDENDEDVVPYNSLPPEERMVAEIVRAAVYESRFYLDPGAPEDVIVPLSLQNLTPKQKEAWEEENETKLPTEEKTTSKETKVAPQATKEPAKASS